MDYEITLPRPSERPPGYPEYPTTLGEHIRKRRMDEGLRLKDLAQRWDIDEGSLINWEKRGRLPSVAKRSLIDAFLGFGTGFVNQHDPKYLRRPQGLG